MRRWVTMISLAIGALAVAAVYDIERRVDDAEASLARIEAERAALAREIHVLEVEWSYQTRPGRIQHLAAENLDLSPTPPERVLTESSELSRAMRDWQGVIQARAGEQR